MTKYIESMKVGDRVTLAREAKKMIRAELARRIGLAQQSLKQIEDNRTVQPRRIKKIAEVLETTPEWLQFGTGKKPYYLTEGVFIPEGKIPLIPWEHVSNWHNSYKLNSLLNSMKEKNNILEAKIDFIDVPASKNNPKLFALKVKGDSMMSPYPFKRSFVEDDILIVDPNAQLKRDSFVIILQKGSNEALFKQYVVEGKNEYLFSLNPQYLTIPFDENIDVCGIVISGIYIFTELNEK